MTEAEYARHLDLICALNEIKEALYAIAQEFKTQKSLRQSILEGPKDGTSPGVDYVGGPETTEGLRESYQGTCT